MVYFLAVIGFCEILLMWYEAYTGDLTKLHASSVKPAAGVPAAGVPAATKDISAK